MIGIATFVGAVFFYDWLIRQAYSYRLKQPHDRREREALVSRLEAELEQWRELERAYPGSATDADRLWPLDRLPIILAIEQYHLQTGKPPPRLTTLVGAKLLAQPTLADLYKITIRTGQWEVRRLDTGYLLAVGN